MGWSFKSSPSKSSKATAKQKTAALPRTPSADAGAGKAEGRGEETAELVSLLSTAYSEINELTDNLQRALYDVQRLEGGKDDSRCDASVDGVGASAAQRLRKKSSLWDSAKARADYCANALTGELSQSHRGSSGSRRSKRSGNGDDVRQDWDIMIAAGGSGTDRTDSPMAGDDGGSSGFGSDQSYGLSANRPTRIRQPGSRAAPIGPPLRGLSGLRPPPNGSSSDGLPDSPGGSVGGRSSSDAGSSNSGRTSAQASLKDGDSSGGEGGNGNGCRPDIKRSFLLARISELEETLVKSSVEGAAAQQDCYGLRLENQGLRERAAVLSAKLEVAAREVEAMAVQLEQAGNESAEHKSEAALLVSEMELLRQTHKMEIMNLCNDIAELKANHRAELDAANREVAHLRIALGRFVDGGYEQQAPTPFHREQPPLRTPSPAVLEARELGAQRSAQQTENRGDRRTSTALALATAAAAAAASSTTLSQPWHVGGGDDRGRKAPFSSATEGAAGDDAVSCRSFSSVNSSMFQVTQLPASRLAAYGGGRSASASALPAARNAAPALPARPNCAWQAGAAASVASNASPAPKATAAPVAPVVAAPAMPASAAGPSPLPSLVGGGRAGTDSDSDYDRFTIDSPLHPRGAWM